MCRFCRPTLLAFLLVATAHAQETRSMIYGRVLDPQGRAIAGAAVTVTHTETNTASRLETNETGYYEANLLIPGGYQVTAESPGFKKTVRGGLTLPVSARLEIDLRLEIGEVAETISVTAEAPILDASTVSSGRVLDNRSLMDLPVLGNSAIQLVKLAPGIQTGGVNNYVGLHSNSSGSGYSINGNVGGNEWTIDGVPNNGNSRQAAYLPYSDTLQEFKVETSNFDASVGHTSGIGVAMTSKAGTNRFHGTLTEQHWQQRWNGTPFFIKQQYYRDIAAAEAAGNTQAAAALRNQDKQPSGRSNNYAATIGGPVTIPKVYNGRDRLFFFFSFNGYIDKKTDENNAINHTIPTLADRRGDFSQLLNVDSVRYQVYDPLSVRPDPARATHYIRDAFPRNALPASRLINPAYGFYQKLLPTPNNDPANPKAEPRNNYLSTGSPFDWNYRAYSNRIDYRMSDRHRFFGRWNWHDWVNDSYDWTWNWEPAKGLHTIYSTRHNLGGTLDWVWTASSSTVIDASVAANQFRDGEQPTVPMKYKPSDVGLPKYMDDKAGDMHVLPQMIFTGYESLSRSNFPIRSRYRALTGKVEISHVRGRHTARAGFDARGQFRTGGGGGNTSGNFTFNNSYTRRYDDSFTPTGDFGHSWAAFMMGLPSSMSVANNDSYALSNPYYGAYVQDNWRLTSKLTLNLGLRMELEYGASERYNRAIGWFDPTLEAPIAAAALAAYAARPLAELPASGFLVRGGSVYPGVNGVSRRLWNTELMLLPRLAAAYQLNSKTVLRGGYGVYFDTLNVLNWSPDQSGYSRSTSPILSTDFGVNWLVGNPRAGVSPLVDPFPVRADGTRWNEPTRDALGVMAKAGRGFSYNDPEWKHPRQQRWRIGVQRQITPNMVVEAAYAGTVSDRIAISRSLSALPEKYWAGGLVRNDAVANDLNTNLPNPFLLSNFAGLERSSPLVYQDMGTMSFYTSSTIRKSALLRPFVHMNGLTQSNYPEGKVRTHALEASFERRFSKGLNFNASYTRLNEREALSYLNEFDPLPFWREGSSTRPHRFIATSLCELPFGRGRKWLRGGPLNLLFGAWQVGSSYEFQPGQLLGWGNYFYYGEPAEVGAGERTLDRWFNTANFERTSSKAPNSFHRRIFPTQISGLRQDRTSQWNANLQREFRIRERVAVQLRADWLNLQNRSQFAGPDTNPFSTNFGKVTAQTSAMNRFLQIQLRIRF